MADWEGAGSEAGVGQRSQKGKAGGGGQGKEEVEEGGGEREEVKGFFFAWELCPCREFL